MTIIRLLAVGLVTLGVAGCQRQHASPANPPGTSATRALDRAAGTNVSGAYPMQSDGMPGNPPGTAAVRAIEGAVGPSGSR